MNNMIDLIQKYDSHNIYNVLKSFPGQVNQGLDIGHEFDVSKIDTVRIRNIVITGLGGSAIGGDIMRSYLASDIDVPIVVNRHYSLPHFVNQYSLVIVSSYSGDTEETLSAFDFAVARGAQVLVITSGGKLGAIAKDMKLPTIFIPGGLAPRCALGYSFFPLLKLFIKLRLIDDRLNEINVTVTTIQHAVDIYSNYDSPDNQALEIARKIQNKIPIIYSAQDRFDAVNMRWRCQLNENAKVLAFGNYFPELNHNEIVGWEQMPDLLKRFAVILLMNKDEHPRIQPRFKFTLETLKPLAADIIEYKAEEETLLARIFGLICLGDWVSFYAAILSGIDPFPIVKINALKKFLSK